MFFQGLSCFIKRSGRVRGVRFVLLGVYWLCLLNTQGCKLYDRAKTALFGRTAEEGIKIEKRNKPPSVDPQMEERKSKAIRLVKKANARRGWTVAKEVKEYQKIAAVIAKKKHLAKPTGFEWSAICATGGACKVRMTFWDGRQPLQAVWLVSDGVVPLNCWAYSFMARLKQAKACFAKVAAEEAKKQAAMRRKAAGGNIWEKGKKGKKPQHDSQREKTKPNSRRSAR